MKRNLRKAFAFILALTMVVSLFACGKKDANPDGGDSSSDDMKQKVEYLRKESGNIVDMECISANIDRLGKAVAALNEMKLKASELSEVRIRAFNDTLLRLSRAITNAFYTNAEKYDQDSYGRTILSKPLPLLFPTIKLSRLDKDTLEYRLLYTQMLRNRNRVADAVLTACEYAELFLAQK